MALVGGDVGTVVLFQFRQGAKDFRHIFLEFGSAHLGGPQNMLPVSKALQRFRILLQYITGCSCGCCMYPTYNYRKAKWQHEQHPFKWIPSCLSKNSHSFSKWSISWLSHCVLISSCEGGWVGNAILLEKRWRRTSKTLMSTYIIENLFGEIYLLKKLEINELAVKNWWPSENSLEVWIWRLKWIFYLIMYNQYFGFN